MVLGSQDQVVKALEDCCCQMYLSPFFQGRPAKLFPDPTSRNGLLFYQRNYFQLSEEFIQCLGKLRFYQQSFGYDCRLLFWKYRKHHYQGGGVAIFARDFLCTKLFSTSHGLNNSTESIWLEVSYKTFPFILLLGCGYRPPSSPPISVDHFFSEVETALSHNECTGSQFSAYYYPS